MISNTNIVIVNIFIFVVFGIPLVSRLKLSLPKRPCTPLTIDASRMLSWSQSNF
jgi:hypothetical protein